MNKEQHTQLPFFGIPMLFPHLKKYRGTIIFMVVLGFACSLIDTIYPLFNRYVLDHFIADQTLDTLPLFIVLYLVTMIAQAVIVYRSMIDSGRVEMCMNRDLRNAAFDHLQKLSFSYFNQNSVGYIHARVMSDSGKIGEAVSWRMMDIVWNGSYILFALIMMVIVNVRLALMTIVLLLLSSVIIRALESRMVALGRKVRELNARITGNFNEGISGARSIRLLGIEKRMRGEFEEDSEEMRRTSIHTMHYAALFGATVTLMSAAALALVLWQGGSLTREGLLKLGTLSVFMSYALGMIEPLQTIISNLAAFVQIQVNIERLTRLLREEPDVADTPEVIAKYGDSFEPRKENWEEFKGDIEFEDVSFRYPDGKEYIMEHFSLKVPHGMNVAIVGETGAGKSTLVNLVCRFYEPTKGRILIDGRDARDRSQLWLHAHLGYVLQSPLLFSGTIRDNLRYGKPDAADEEIIRALKLVSADGAAARLGAGLLAGAAGHEEVTAADHMMHKGDSGEDADALIRAGLDAEVGEGGSALSTGEKQLISFARALIADPRLLVLDEATASVDSLTEQEIQKAIRTVTAGRTSFVIAHRLSTVVDADLILVVDDGRIIERGTHKELLARKGFYHELYTRQYERDMWNKIE